MLIYYIYFKYIVKFFSCFVINIPTPILLSICIIFCIELSNRTVAFAEISSSPSHITTHIGTLGNILNIALASPNLYSVPPRPKASIENISLLYPNSLINVSIELL